jgi:hypothetical protein
VAIRKVRANSCGCWLGTKNENTSIFLFRELEVTCTAGIGSLVLRGDGLGGRRKEGATTGGMQPGTDHGYLLPYSPPSEKQTMRLYPSDARI